LTNLYQNWLVWFFDSPLRKIYLTDPSGSITVAILDEGKVVRHILKQEHLMTPSQFWLNLTKLFLIFHGYAYKSYFEQNQQKNNFPVE
jgi:high-affinity nickel permease